MQNEKGQSRFDRFIRAVKWLSVAYIAGSLSGATIWNNYVLTSVAKVQEIALQGNCAYKDVLATVYWISCSGDSSDAEIQASVLQGKDTEEILADMNRKHNGGRRK